MEFLYTQFLALLVGAIIIPIGALPWYLIDNKFFYDSNLGTDEHKWNWKLYFVLSLVIGNLLIYLF